MTSQDRATELHRIYRRGKDSGLSDEQIDALLMLADSVQLVRPGTPPLSHELR